MTLTHLIFVFENFYLFFSKIENLNSEGSFIQLSTNEETGFIWGRRLETIHHLSLSTRRCLFERRDVDLLKSDYFYQTQKKILEKIKLLIYWPIKSQKKLPVRIFKEKL